MHFPIILKFPKIMVGYSLEGETLAILWNYGRIYPFILKVNS